MIGTLPPEARDDILLDSPGEFKYILNFFRSTERFKEDKGIAPVKPVSAIKLRETKALPANFRHKIRRRS
jgi:hypothetical protein